MKGIFKILLGLIGSVVLVLILAAVVLPLVYDKDDLKQAIATQVHKQTGRDLRIDGPLDFSVFPWLAVNVGDLTLSNAEGFGDQPFAHIGKVKVGVALMPLFRKQLVADEITLEGLQLDLAVNARGKNNWDDLAGQEEDRTGVTEESPGAGSGLFASQSVAGLNIRDAQIGYRDQQAKTAYRLDQFSIQTGALGEAKPVPVRISGFLEDLNAGMRLKMSLTAVAALDMEAQNHVFEDVDLSLSRLAEDAQGDRGAPGEAVTLQSPRVEASLAAQTLELETFTASLAGLQASGSINVRNFSTKPVFEGALQIDEFSPRKLMQALSMQAPVTADPEVLQRASLSASVKGDSSNLTLDDFQAELDQSQLSGEMSVRNFERPGIRFDFAVDAIDLDRYMEPAGDESAAKTDVAMPGDELHDLDLQGSLRVGELHLAGLQFSNAVVGINASGGKLRINPLTAKFYDGSYSGNITLDGSGTVPVLSLDEKLDSVTFQRLVADITDNENLSGLAQGHVRLTGRGATSDAVLGSLAGDLGLTLNEGALEGINIWYEIRRGYALYKGLAPPEPEPKRTVFSRMQLDATVENGVLSTRELAADLPFLSVRGDGTVNLAQSDMDLRLTAIVRSAPELARDPLAADLQGKQLPFKVSGLLADPKVSIDWTKLLKSEATEKILDKLGLKAQPAAADGDQEETSGKDQTKEAAKGMLFDLLGGKDKKKDK